MMKLNEYLRKGCALALSMMMALTPAMPLGVAEDESAVPSVVVNEATPTLTAEPTPEPVKEQEPSEPTPTVEPEESADPTQSVEPTESAEPSTVPEASISPEASVSPDPAASPDASVEPSEMPLELVGDVSLADAGDITTTDTAVTLFGDGDTWQWTVKRIDGVTATIQYSVDAANTAHLSISNMGRVTTKVVSEKVEAKIYAQVIGDDSSKLTCTVTVLPKPKAIAFKDVYQSGINLTTKSAEGYYLKTDSDGEPRYELTFDSSVDENLDRTDYDQLIFFRSSNQARVPINTKTGELANRPDDYETLPAEATITITLKSMGSASLSGEVLLTIYDMPTEILLGTGNPSTIPVGYTFKPTFYAVSKTGAVVKMDDSSFEIVDESEGGAVTIEGLSVTGAKFGLATIMIKTKDELGQPIIESPILSLTVQDVPSTIDDLKLVDTNTNLQVWPLPDGADPDDQIEMGIGQSLTLRVESRTSKTMYIGKVTASSSAVNLVSASANTNNVVTITANAVTVGSEPTVNIRVNEDLGGEPITIPIKILVRSQPTDIRLSETEYNLCEGDSFTLVAVPLPEGQTSTGYSFSISNVKAVKVEQIATPEGGDPVNGYFKITANENVIAATDTTAAVDVTIRATGGNKPSKVCKITIGRKPTAIGIDADIVTIPVSGSYNLHPYFLGSDGTRFGGTFAFSVDEGTGVTVDANGKVTVSKEITSNNGVMVVISSPIWKTLEKIVRIKSANPDVFGFSFDKASYMLALGESITVQPSIYPNGSRINLTFSLSPSNAYLTHKPTSDGMGVVLTAAKSTGAVGEYQLTATDGTTSASCTIVVGTAPKSITTDKSYAMVTVGETIVPGYTLSPSTAATSGVYYSIEPLLPSDFWIKDSTGMVTGYKEKGEAVTDNQPLAASDGAAPASIDGTYQGTYIRATKKGIVRVEMRTAASAHNAGVRKQWLIEIVDAPDYVEFLDKKNPVTLLSGMTATQKAQAYDQQGNAVDNVVMYSSSDASVATVDSNGVVTAKRTGITEMRFAIITATANGARDSDTYQVNVYDAPTYIKLASDNGSIVPDDADESEDGSVNHYAATIGVGQAVRVIPSFDNVVNLKPEPMKYTNEGQGYVKVEAESGREYGTVTGQKAGNTEVVTVSAPNGTYADVTFTVLSKPSKLTITNTKLNIGLSESIDMSSIVKVWKNSTTLADETVQRELIYSTSDSTLGYVDPNTGKVTVYGTDASKLGKSFTITAASVCSGITAVKCTFTIAEKPEGLLLDQTAPMVREDVAGTISMMAGEAKDTQVYKFVARFLPAGAAGFVDYLHGLEPTNITFTDDEDDDDYNADACLYVYTELDKNGNSVLCIQPVNGKPGIVHFTPHAASGNLSTILTVNVTETSAAKDEVTFKTPITMAVGMTHQIIPEFRDTNISADITYTSTNTTYLSVGSKTGLVTAKRAYANPVNVVATWKHNGITQTEMIEFNVVGTPTAVYFKVFQPDSEPAVAQDKLTSLTVNLSENETYRFGYHFAPDNAMSDDVTLTIGNTSHERYLSATLIPDEDGRGGVIQLSRTNTTAVYTGRITYTLKAGSRSRSFYVNLTETPKGLTISPYVKSGIEMNPGESKKFTASFFGGGGGMVYYTCEPEPGEDSPVESLNSHTGELVINDWVENTTTVNVTAHTTAVSDDNLDMTKATSLINVLGSMKPEDIEDRLYLKGTKDLYVNADSDTFCAGDVLSLQCLYNTKENFTRKYPIVFVTEDTYYLRVSSSNNAATITFLNETQSGKPVAVYAVPSNLKESYVKYGLKLEFTILPKATSVKWHFADATEEANKRKSGFKLNEKDVINLTADYNMTVEVLPAAAAAGMEVIGYSSNDKVATIKKNDDDEWILTATGTKGSATITFANSTKKLKDSFKVTVYALPTEIRLSSDDITLGEGMSQTITASYVGGSTEAGVEVFNASPYATIVPNVDGNVMKFTVIGDDSTMDLPNKKRQMSVRTLEDKSTAITDLYVKVYPGPTAIKVDSVSNTEAGATPVIYVGETKTLYYSVEADNLDEMKTTITFSENGDADANAGAGSVSWSGNKQLSKVGKTELNYSIKIKGVNAGTTTFKIKSANGKEAEQKFTVMESVKGLVLNAPTKNILMPMRVKDEAQPQPVEFTYSLLDSNGKVIQKPVIIGVPTVTSSNSKLVSVSLDAESNTVAVQPNTEGATGSSTIKVTVNGKSASLKVTVSKTTNSAKTKISISPSSVTLTEGETKKLDYVISNGIGGDVSFEEEDESNVSLNLEPDGWIAPEVIDYASAKGKTWVGYVYATLDAPGLPDGSIESKRVKVTVRKGPENLDNTTIAQSSITLGLGESVSFKHVKEKGESYSTKFKYHTTNRYLVSVSTSGSIKGVGVGDNTMITMESLNDKKATVDVSVKKAPTGIYFSAEESDIVENVLRLTVGDDKEIKLHDNLLLGVAGDTSIDFGSYKLTCSGAKKGSLEVTSALGDDGVTTFTIEALKKGTYTLSFKTFNNKSRSLKVVVTE